MTKIEPHRKKLFSKKIWPHSPEKHLSWVAMCHSITGHIFLCHHCTARNAVLDTPEYTSYANSDQSLGTFSQLNDPWFCGQLIHSYSVLRSWWHFCQFYDTEYAKTNDNNFHMSPPISTYHTSNCLYFHKLSTYVHQYCVQDKMGPSNKMIR